MTEVIEAKKWIREYQPKDESGYPVGPPQRFEADTQQELIDKLAAAHENASSALYKTRLQVKLGTMLEPDPEEPIRTFEPRSLSADERIKLTKDLSDPAKAADAHRTLLEAELGAPIEIIRTSLRDAEIQKRVESIKAAIDAFRKEHPEYIDSTSNGDKIKKYMEKKNLRYSVKNLNIAFEDLKSDGVLTLQVPKAAVPETPVAPVATAPATLEVIPPAATTAPAIPVTPTEVRPKQSSSGLGREHSSAAPSGEPPKVTGITIRDINRMSAKEYNDNLRDPEFRKAVEKLYEKK